jgi:hypothetical protein
MVVLQERVVTFVVRQEEGSETISKAALLQFLQHEYEVGLTTRHQVVKESCRLAVLQPSLHAHYFIHPVLMQTARAFCLSVVQNADSSDAPTPQPQMQFMPFQQAGWCLDNSAQAFLTRLSLGIQAYMRGRSRIVCSSEASCGICVFGDSLGTHVVITAVA